MYKDFIITHKKSDSSDAFHLQIKPKEATPIKAFKPGQYCKMKNLTYKNPQEEHIFSIASSPNTNSYLEFYIRVYGDWTKTVSTLLLGSILQVDYPHGSFIFDMPEKENIVFLVGGVGIAPIMSMLRYICEQQQSGNYVLIYGNRTQETIAFKTELDRITKHLDTIRIVHVFSELTQHDPWSGYRGFVTKEILEKEVDFSLQPTFFITGPPVFTQKMNTLLQNLSVNHHSIKHESLS